MKKKAKYFFLIMGLFLIVILGYRLWREFTPDIQMLKNPKVSKELFLHSIRSHGISTGLLFILATSVMCAIPGIPTSILGIFVGVCYGPFVGSLLNIAGNTLGNVLSIIILRKFNILDASKKSNRWVQTLSKAKHSYIDIMIAYMIPVIPSFLVNFTVNLLGLRIKEFLPLILFGVFPSSILYACGGDAIFKGNHLQASLLIASVVVLVLLVALIKHDKKQEMK